jgi:hypothetical protein
MTPAKAGDQLTSIQTGPLVHVMIVNFSHEKFEFPKATVPGIAEETSASIVAEINYEVKPNSEHSRKLKCVNVDANFVQYLQDKLGHLTQKQRSVMETALKVVTTSNS